MVDIVTAEQAGMVPDFGGPDVRDFKGGATSWLRLRKPGKRLVNLWLPFKFSRQSAAGRLLCPQHRNGTITFEQYLAMRYSVT